MSVTATQWHRVRASVSAVLERLLALVEGVPPDRAVTAHWTMADTLAHLTTIASMGVVLVKGTPPALRVPGVLELRNSTTVDTVAVMNRVTLSHFTERRVPVLADRLRADVEELVRAAETADPQRLVTWLGGSNMPVAGLFAHLLNEMNIHAWDIAQAVGAPWEIDPEDAALFIDLFLVGVTSNGYGKLLDHDRPVRRGRISVTFRSRFSTPVTFALTDGKLTVEPPDASPDVRLSYDPVTFTLMLFGRVSRVRAMLTGKVAVAGRRPWLLPKFLETMRMPS